MQKLKTLSHDYLTDKVIRNLANNRITTVLDFLQEEPEKLTILTKLNLEQIISIRSDIFKKLSAPLINGSSLLAKYSLKRRYMSTGITDLDTALEGGLPLGHIVEICGLSNSGKTQLCHQLAVNSVKTSKSTVLYIDTKGDFSAVRIQKILDGCRYSHKDMALIMMKIRVVHIWNMQELVDLMKQIKNKLLGIDKLSLIIVDSLPSLMFQHLGDDNKIGLSLLNVFVNYARYLTKEMDIGVVCVNIQTRWIDQDVSDIDDDDQSTLNNKDTLYQERRIRCLGKYWQHIPSVVLMLQKSQESTDDKFPINITVNRFIPGLNNKTCTLFSSTLGIT